MCVQLIDLTRTHDSKQQAARYFIYRLARISARLVLLSSRTMKNKHSQALEWVMGFEYVTVSVSVLP